MATVTKSAQWGVGLALLGAFVAAGSAAQTADPEEPRPEERRGITQDGTASPLDADLLSRIEVLSEQSRALESAGDALEHARRALARAAEHDRMGPAPAAERARLIARAAVLLAERQIALEQERRAMRAAHRRASEAITKARQARQALEHARAERERAREADPTYPRSRQAEDQGEGN